MEITRVGDFTLGFGESLVWDEQRNRLYFVDCAARALHWLDDGNDHLHTYLPKSMPIGLAPTTAGTLVAVLDDGLHEIDADAGTSRLITAFPQAMGGRGNDICADLHGNLITGKMNTGPGEGSSWWYSTDEGWRLIDPDISNTNGPGVAILDGEMTLIIGDTSAQYFAYPYSPSTGAVGDRRVFGDTTALDGLPDGTTFDAKGGLWCALMRGGQLARFTTAGLDRTVALPVKNPTDVTFGGPGLDRLYVVSVGSRRTAELGFRRLDGALLVIDGLDVIGRPEPRARLAG